MTETHESEPESAQPIDAPEESLAARLRELALTTPWMHRLLHSVRAVAPPQWVVGGGAIRNLVWDHLEGLAAPTPLRDVDVAYFDARDLAPEAEARYRSALEATAPEFRWQVKNQARVHLWYQDVFHDVISPITSIEDAVARFPETCTAVALRLEPDDRLSVLAPCGLDDLFGQVLRRNDRQISYELFLKRLADKQVQRTWPRVTVVYEHPDGIPSPLG